MLNKQNKVINLTAQSMDENDNVLANFTATIYPNSNRYSINQTIENINDEQNKQVDTDFADFKDSIEAMLPKELANE